ncbi:MAG TPA: GntR family transcriptional regulator [Trebonia sp.]
MSESPGGWRLPASAQAPLRPVTKTDLAYRQIRQKILEGDLPPEMSLDQEALAQSLRLSTTPVREALRRLEAERLVVSRAHRETMIAPLSPDTAEEVFAVRLSLDPLAASLAAAQASDSQRERIRALSRQHPSEDDPVTSVYYNRHLHRSIYAASGNTTLTGMLDSLWDLSDRYRLIASRSVAAIAMPGDEHAAIVSAVTDGSPDRAAKLMREHVAASLGRIRAGFSG